MLALPNHPESENVISDIQNLRDAGLSWKDIGDTLNILPRTLHRLRKRAHFEELPENMTIGKLLLINIE